MEKVFEILANVKTPLAVAAIALGVLLYILTSLINKEKEKKGFDGYKLDPTHQYKLYSRIATFVFILLLITIILAFAAFLAPTFTKPDPPKPASSFHLKFNVMERSANRPLDSVSVSILDMNNSPIMSNANGYISFIVSPGDFDDSSLLLNFRSQKHGIDTTITSPLINPPKIYYFEKRNAITFIPPAPRPKESVERGKIKMPPSVNFITNTRSIIQQVNLNSKTETIIEAELGDKAKETFSFPNLTVAKECSPNEIRYYWRYLHESFTNEKIAAFLTEKGLISEITSNSYMVYSFENNTLCRIELRLFSNNAQFYNQLLRSLGEPVRGSNSFKTNSNGVYYFTSTYIEDKQYVASIVLANQTGASACQSDWWNGKSVK